MTFKFNKNFVGISSLRELYHSFVVLLLIVLIDLWKTLAILARYVYILSLYICTYVFKCDLCNLLGYFLYLYKKSDDNFVYVSVWYISSLVPFIRFSCYFHQPQKFNWTTQLGRYVISVRMYVDPQFRLLCCAFVHIPVMCPFNCCFYALQTNICLPTIVINTKSYMFSIFRTLMERWADMYVSTCTQKKKERKGIVVEEPRPYGNQPVIDKLKVNSCQCF